MNRTIRADFIKITQPIGEFYCCSISAEELYEISYADIRRLEEEQNSEDGLDTYLGIQRELSSVRVNKLKEYVKSVDATFPNSIIIAIDDDFVRFDDKKLIIEFDRSKEGKVAKILDGQHRLAGFEGSDFKYKNQDDESQDFQLLVTIFVEADLHTQAQVFTMVNQNQTKVNKSLVYDLESLAIARSPYKTAHQIAILLNSRKDSPFYKRIKRLGVKTNGVEGELITQAAIVDNLIKLITKKASLDRDILLGKKKKFLGLKNAVLPDLTTADYRRLTFRKSFNEEDDSSIALNILNYYSAIANIWPQAWDKTNKSSVLNKTVGLIATMRLLRDIFNFMVDNSNVEYGEVISENEYSEILKAGNIQNEFFAEFEAVSKSSGHIYKKLKAILLK